MKDKDMIYKTKEFYKEENLRIIQNNIWIKNN